MFRHFHLLASTYRKGAVMEILSHDQNTKNYTKQPMLEDKLLTTQEVADFLRVDRATLYRWRRADVSPEYYSLGGKVLYRISDLNRFLSQNTHTSLEIR